MQLGLTTNNSSRWWIWGSWHTAFIFTSFLSTYKKINSWNIMDEDVEIEEGCYQCIKRMRMNGGEITYNKIRL